ncbi:hypothetical protein ACFL2Q_11230 [Thermodesulfobacteriota bacterium]
MTYLFTKDGCDKCDWVKDKVDLDKMDDMQVMNLGDEDAEALAMLAYFECVTLAEKQMPILVADSGAVIAGAIPIRKYFRENVS